MARTRQPEVSNDVTRLITQIRAMIGKGEELPPERLLADQLKVKRHRLRLALETMRDAAELPRPIIRRNDSPVLKSDVVVQGTNALEVIELRIVLEPAIARLAAVRASPVQIAKILEAATTPQGVTRTIGDIAFHKLLADSSGNQLAASLYAFLRRVGSDHRLHVPMASAITSERIQQRDQEHRAIAEAIAARSPDAAEQAMRQHLRRVQREIADRLNPLETA
ncbi:FadR/GntR family transcriptional regulator [Achromobacter sp. AONIH1]|jgi:DNA-binding FadR family transcriptional regulator|uniref:FadR/GntR family transcriptional regulator n=1 Tax=unclassified Achromobacter TaxID=2626865 RepID=UPI000CD148BA|nr:FCD domain-containing protein [Achromobacter sp. AONIH1]AUT48520.1 FadR family transcriptional regulator [Achromobacter sp. AONIH1]